MTTHDETAEPDSPGRMSFLEHLDELRRRLLYSVYSVLGALAISFVFVDDVLEFITGQMTAVVGPLQGVGSLDPIMVIFKTALLVAVVVAAPFILLQVWYFIAPGLYANEKKLAIPFVFVTTALFMGGAAFAHYLAFPVTWEFLKAIQPKWMDWHPIWNDTFALYLRMVLGLGLIFQMPVVVFVLARFGLVSAGFLARNFKYAIVIIFIVAAVASPGQDPTSQLLFAAPMMVLYVVSIGVAWVFAKKKPAEDEA